MLKGMCCKWHFEGVSLGAQNAGRPVNKVSERKQFGLILFGLAYLQHFHRSYAFDTSSVVPLRSSSCQSPDPVLSRPFPSVLTTMAFDHSRRRWFGTCSCQPVPRGLIPHRSSSYAHGPFSALCARGAQSSA